MTLFAYITNNMDRIKEGIKLGIISTSVLHHWEIYSRFDSYRKAGNSVPISVLWAGADKRVSERTVYFVIKRMTREI